MARIHDTITENSTPVKDFAIIFGIFLAAFLAPALGAGLMLLALGEQSLTLAGAGAGLVAGGVLFRRLTA